MKPSDITVVIPTYKRPSFLARSLESIVQQGIGVRIRVVDNASGDDTEQVVRAMSRRHPIDYVCHAKNYGVPWNMIYAINSVETPYCLVLNDDDMHLPGLIDEAMSAMPRHPQASAFCGRMLMFRGGDLSPITVHGATWNPGFYAAGSATAHMVLEHFPPTAVLYKTDALRAAKMELSDREMMARFADANGFVVSDKILGAIVVHPQGWSSSQSRDTVRRMALSQLTAYLQLPSLSDQDRIDILLVMSAKLLENEVKAGLDAVRKGDSAPRVRDMFTKAARALGGLPAPDRPLAKRAFYRIAAIVSARQTTEHANLVSSAVMRGSWRIARAFERLAELRRDFGPDVDDALSKIGALDRKAKAFYGELRSSAGPAAPHSGDITTPGH